MMPSGSAGFTSLDELFRSNNSNINEQNSSSHASVPRSQMQTFVPRPGFEGAGYGADAGTSAARPSSAPFTSNNGNNNSNYPPTATQYMPHVLPSGAMMQPGMQSFMPSGPAPPSSFSHPQMSDLPPPPNSYGPASLSKNEMIQHYHQSFLQPPAHPPRVPYPQLQQQTTVLAPGGLPLSAQYQTYGPPQQQPQQHHMQPQPQPQPQPQYVQYVSAPAAYMPLAPHQPIPVMLPAAPAKAAVMSAPPSLSSPSSPPSTPSSEREHKDRFRDFVTSAILILFLVMTVMLWQICRNMKR